MYLFHAPTTNAVLAAAPGGKAATFNTLRLMREAIKKAKVDPAIINAAHSIIFHTTERDSLGEVEAIFNFVRDSVRYVMDVHGVETLSYPVLTMQRRTGDCDDQTALLCALLESVGYPTRLVMTQYVTDDFEHVYCQVLVDGVWLDLDPIERSAFVGYAPPNPVRTFIETV